MDFYTETNNCFFHLFEETINYKEVYDKIRKDPMSWWMEVSK